MRYIVQWEACLRGSGCGIEPGEGGGCGLGVAALKLQIGSLVYWTADCRAQQTVRELADFPCLSSNHLRSRLSAI